MGFCNDFGGFALKKRVFLLIHSHTGQNMMASVDAVQASVVGADAVLKTPFGDKPLVYADYGASGRASSIVEARLAESAALYANPHNEDSATGHAATAALHEAVARIKRAVGADDRHALIACGSGATAGVHRLQEILGVAIPPATKAFFDRVLDDALDEAQRDALVQTLEMDRPVVFIGPYEHHSNELSWRESLAEVVSIGLGEDGHIDFADLEAQLTDARFAGRRKIGAFSAASNVTGVRTDVARLARLLHKHDAILTLDCAASAPYLPIAMASEDEQACVDAVYFSPHKMIGGPGSCGVLVIDKALYRADLAPSCSGGGTVRYVTPDQHDFIDDVEARERAGTPGLLQLMRAAEALDLLTEIGWDQVEAREHAHLHAALEAWSREPGLTIYGPVEASQRIGLVSFNLTTADGALVHPKFVARLLNDVFGIQARAGCSCAGPYGHLLLELDPVSTDFYRGAVEDGFAGLRPGWVRVSLHWSMSEAEREYLIDAVRFLAAHAERFLPAYRFDAHTGRWDITVGEGQSAIARGLGGAALRPHILVEAEKIAQGFDQLRVEPTVLPARFAMAGPIAGLSFSEACGVAAE